MQKESEFVHDDEGAGEREARSFIIVVASLAYDDEMKKKKWKKEYDIICVNANAIV